MNSYRRSLKKFRSQKGMTAIMMAVCLTMLIGFAAMAVDVGYVMLTKNELQNIADATALWGARWLGDNYRDMTYAQQQAYVCNPGQIISDIQEVALESYAGGMDGITINAGDVRIGTWDPNGTPPLTQTLNQPDAVSVTVRRDGAANGPISSVFARVLGLDTFDISADATAALTGQGESSPGELELPVGISAYFFDGYGCNDWIKFSPTNDPDACAGWTSWDYNANDANMRKILEQDPRYESPETSAAEDTANFIGGDLSTNTFDALLTLYREKGYDYNPNTGQPIETAVIDGEDAPVAGHHSGGVPLFDDDGVTRLEYPDGTPRNYHKWETLVVVYDWYDCDNPNTAIRIAGYAMIDLTDVVGPPDKLLRGQIMCNLFSNGDNRGGGGNYGTMGTIPGLVE
jgi:Flp pilus assembly protein TadG